MEKLTKKIKRLIEIEEIQKHTIQCNLQYTVGKVAAYLEILEELKKQKS